jgi:hypothetical protein
VGCSSLNDVNVLVVVSSFLKEDAIRTMTKRKVIPKTDLIVFAFMIVVFKINDG